MWFSMRSALALSASRFVSSPDFSRILTHRGKAGAALNRISRLYRARGDTEAARAFLNRGMALFKAAGDEKGVAACLGDLGELAGRQGSYNRAFKLVNEALDLQRKLENKPSIAVCLHRLGHVERAEYALSSGGPGTR